MAEEPTATPGEETDPELATEPDSEPAADPAADSTTGSVPAIPDDPLVVWALASFHTGLLVAVLVTALHLAGPLGELLAGLSTTVGLVIYLGLWATTWWTNRRWLRAAIDPETGGSVVRTGMKWGGVNGTYFFWLLVVVNVVPLLTPENLARVEPDFAVFFVVALGIGSILALGIGGIVGSLFAIFDLALVRVAARIVPETRPPEACE
jgi:hypothetical protein